MKVLCDRERLREGLTVVTSVIPLKSTRPAIENVCLVASDDALELVGTDLDVVPEDGAVDPRRGIDPRLPAQSLQVRDVVVSVFPHPPGQLFSQDEMHGFTWL